MKLIIEQNWRGYKMFKNDTKDPILTAKWKGGLFRKRICEFRDENSTLVCTFEISVSQWFWSKKESIYLIKLIPTSEQIEVRVISFKKGCWKFKYQDEEYEFYSHRGHKKSLFKSEVQVAKFDKGNVNFGQSDRATIFANNDQNAIILCALFIAYDQDDDRDADITIDFGQWSKGVKEFDENWRPAQ